MNDKKQKKFIIIDGNALLHRAWHAIPVLTAPSGQVVNALYGFASILFKVLREMQPEHIVVAWDRKEPTFRHKEFKAYKAHREKKPDELYAQIDLIKRLLDLLKIQSLEAAGFEGDDIIATIVKLSEKKSSLQNIILTGDLDTLQLVSDKTNVLTLRKGITDTVLYDKKAVMERYGLRPAQLVDFKALRGDPSDNISGVKGIGEKGAISLLQEFDRLEEIYKHLDLCASGRVRCRIKESTANTLEKGRDSAFLSKKLVTLIENVKIDLSLEQIGHQTPDQSAVSLFLTQYGFKTLVDRLKKTEIKMDADEASTKKQGGLFDKTETAVGKASLLKTINSNGEIESLIKKIRSSGSFAFKTLFEGEDVFFAKFLGIGIATDEKNVFFVEAGTEKLRELFIDEKIKKIGHDIKNDYKFLSLAGIGLRKPFFDCKIASYILNPGNRSNDFDSLVLRILEKQRHDTEDKKEMTGDDAIKMLLIAETLEKEISNQSFNKLVELEFSLLPVLGDMELAGILIDKKFLEKMSHDFATRLAVLAGKIYKLVGEEFNISSPQQLANILFNKLKLVPKTGKLRRGKTGISTAAAELEKLRGAHPTIEMLFEYRELSKLKSTYVDALPALINPKTKRLHTTYHQTVTATGRLSSSDPNLQNIPIRTKIGQEIRKAFMAPKGLVLISADYSQFELRIAATIANDKNMIEAFKSGADIHTATAAEVWGIKPEKVTVEMRRAAKAINFGITYGMGSLGLAESAGISSFEARKFIENYFKAYPGIKNYIDETKGLARSLGYVETIFGRRRYLPEIVSEIPEVRAGAERMAINMPIQGSQADLVKIAMIRLYEVLPKINPETKMLLQVHDELVFETPKEGASKAATAIKETMEGVYKLKVPIIVDIKIGKSWGEMEPL